MLRAFQFVLLAGMMLPAGLYAADANEPTWVAGRTLEQAKAAGAPICVMFQVPVKPAPKTPVVTAWSTAYATPELRDILKKSFQCITIDVSNTVNAAKLWPREMVDAGKTTKQQIYLLSSDLRMQSSFSAQIAALAAVKTAAENIVKYEKQRKEDLKKKAELEQKREAEKDKQLAGAEDANGLKVPGLNSGAGKKEEKADTVKVPKSGPQDE